MAAETANVLMAGAMGEGYAGLSTRQCLMCLLALYAAGLTMQEMLDGAATNQYQTLSDRQLDQCLLDAIQL